MSLGIYNDDDGFLIGGKVKGALKITKTKDGSYDISLNVNVKDSNKFAFNNKIISLKYDESREINICSYDEEQAYVARSEKFKRALEKSMDFDELYDYKNK